MVKRNVIITGLPGSGKTTLIRRLAAELMPWGLVGFYTEEMREAGLRTGFELVTFSGSRRCLAHVRFQGIFRVGKYGVDVGGLEEFLDALALQDARAGLAVIDEIGRMECLSPKFVGIVRRLLDSDTVVLATAALRGDGLIREVKRRRDTDVFKINPVTRARVGLEISERVLKDLAEGGGEKI